MFRRRLGLGLRRSAAVPPRLARRLLPPATSRVLRRLSMAHELMLQGDPRAAAVIFEEVADAAEARRIPRASQLNLQAGRAWVESGEVERGIKRLHHGLELMRVYAQTERLAAIGRRVIEELNRRGYLTEAQSLEAFMTEVAPGTVLSTAMAEAQPRVRLPGKCPYCGGHVRPDEVEWIAEARALCDYCGSVLEGEI